MAGQWTSIDLSAKLFQNVEEAVLRKSAAALENCFINETGGHSRFPGLKPFVTLPGNANTYVHGWSAPNGDLVAVSNSRVYRINRQGVVSDVTGVPVGGGQRVVFDETDRELVMAAGAEIIALGEGKTTVLSATAPQSSFVGYINGFLLAVDRHSEIFQWSSGDYTTWDPLDTFSADGKPDEINAMAISPFLEVLLCGRNSVEQFEQLPNGTTPFYRRWAVGEGITAPYTVVCVDAGTFGINSTYEFVRMTGQVSQPIGDDLHWTFEKVDNWDGAWAREIQIKGQKFILLQMPNATNAYETLGITALFDYRQKKWSNLYGWANGLPAIWPGCSYHEIWGRRFVGGKGAVYEFDVDAFDNVGQPQRFLGRTAPLDMWGPSFVHNVRMRVKRGVGSTSQPGVAPPQIGLRCIRDNFRKTKWKFKSLGKPGDDYNTIQWGSMGCCDSTWQFEWMVTDPCSVEVVKLEAEVERTM